jgi:thymidylate kinase
MLTKACTCSRAVYRGKQIRTVLKPTIESGDQKLFATVKFYDDQEFSVYFSQMTKKTDENNQQLQKRKEEVVQLRNSLKAKFPEELFYINSSSNIETERTAIIKKLHDYITGELYLNIIKEIAIYTDRLPGI